VVPDFVRIALDSRVPSSGQLELQGEPLVRARGATFQLRYRESLLSDGASQISGRSLQLTLFDVQTAREVLAFHIHDGQPRNHYHLGAGAGALLAPLYKAHIPAGEIDERAFLRMLIADFGVRPLRRNWRTLLAS